MTKRKFLAIATEDTLETEKILKSSEVAAGGGDFSSLRDQLSSKIDTMIEQRDNPVESSSYEGGSSNDESSDIDSSSDSSDSSDDFDFADGGSGEDAEGDPGEDTNDKDSAADDKASSSDEEEGKTSDKDDEKEKDKEAKEHACLFVANTEESLTREFRLIDSNISKEDSTLGAKVWEGIKATGAVFASVASALAYVGISVLWPGLKHLYKGVVYLSAKFIRYSHAGITKIDSEIESFTNRISKTNEEIDAAREIIALLRKKEEEFPDSTPKTILNTFDRSKVIGRIKLGKVTSPIENTAVVAAFLTSWYSKTSRDIEKDSAAIKQVLYYGTQSALNPVKTFGDSSMRNGLVEDRNKTNSEDNEFVSAMKYPDTLPGSLYYCCVVPNGTSRTIDDIRMAYAASRASFTIDTSSFVRIDNIDYMNLNDVEKSLDAISNLVKVLENQKDIYTSIKNEKVMYLNSFKRYLYKLADESERISIEKSMLEYIYLRGVFIDSVYTVTARDIHEYTHKYLANVMIYLRSNLEELSS